MQLDSEENVNCNIDNFEMDKLRLILLVKGKRAMEAKPRN